VDGRVDAPEGYSADIPDGWTYRPRTTLSESVVIDTLFGPASPTDSPTITVACEQLRGSRDATEHVQRRVDRNRSVLGVDTMVSTHELGDRRWDSLSIVIPQTTDITLSRDTWMTIDRSCLWVVTLTTVESKRASWLPVFNTLVATMTFHSPR
jgi:hypothetical protein